MAEEQSEVFRSNAPQEKAVLEGSDAKHKKAAEGPTELRQINDHNASGKADEKALADVHIEKHADDAQLEVNIASAAAVEEAPAPVAAKPVAPAMIEKDDAIPWALSINLADRIKGLGSKTAAVNQELDALEAASQKLAKRIGK